MGYIIAGLVILSGFSFVFFTMNEAAHSGDSYFHEIMIEATVMRLFDETSNDYSAQRGKEHKYFVEFIDKYNKRMIFPIHSYLYKKLEVADHGTLYYRGYKLVKFLPEGKNHHLDSQILQTLFKKNTQMLKFFAYAPAVNLIIPNDRPISITLDKIKNYIFHIHNHGSQSSFGVENEQGKLIQITKKANKKQFVIEMPDQAQRLSYWIDFCIHEQLLEILEIFARNEDVLSRFQARMEQWDQSQRKSEHHLI